MECIDHMKRYKVVIFSAGLLSGLFLGLLVAWLFYVSWRINHIPPYFYDKMSLHQGSLRISLFNSSEVPIDTVVSLDNEFVMGGKISGRGPFVFPIMIPFPHRLPFPEPDGFSTAISPELGKHELSVSVSGGGVLAKKELTQEIGKTNYVSIYIQDKDVGTNRFGCNIFVRTNAPGEM